MTNLQIIVVILSLMVVILTIKISLLDIEINELITKLKILVFIIEDGKKKNIDSERNEKYD